MVRLTPAAIAMAALPLLAAAISPALALPSSFSSSQSQQAVFSSEQDHYDANPLAPSSRRVDLTLGVMSRCPDALACEATLDKAFDRINPKSRIRMAYIGTLNSSATHGVTCMHGDAECAANIQQLCIQHALDPAHAPDRWDLSPSAAQKKWWSFIQCQNYAGLANIGSESLAKRCLALIDGPDWKRDGIEACVEGKQGRKLLERSVRDSHTANITTSCTIQIEGRTRCVRDGGQWRRCDIGHEPADFVAAIDKEWRHKNDGRKKHLEGDAALQRTAAATQAQHLRKRQDPNVSSVAPTASSSPTSSPTGGGLFGGGGNGTPPSVFTLIIAIALFVMVVAFVLLRIIVRNRRLRRLGLLPDGPIDRILGQTREIEDTLAPPKLWEAKIAHDYLPQKQDPDAKIKGWDAVMPVSAALPPSVYSDLFPNDTMPGKAGRNGDDGGNGVNSYPPASQIRTNMIARHMQLPSFLRRGGGSGASNGGNTGGNTGEDAGATDGRNADGSNAGGAAGSDEVDGAGAADDAMPASVNVTVLIAMPSERTIFPSTQLGRKGSSGGVGNAATAVRQQASTPSFPPLTRVKSTRLDEVLHEHDDDADESSAAASGDGDRLRRKASVKSFRTTGSNKSLAEARREAFFGAMTDDAGNAGGAGAAGTAGAGGLDDDEDEELPELVFGTASVPIFCKASGTAGSGGATRKAFSERADSYQPLRRELLNLVAAAHEARERKVRHDEAAKKESGDAEGDEGPRSSAGPRSYVGGGGGGGSGAQGRVSGSETIDSDPGMGLSAMHSTQAEGLGDVVGRMMAQNVDHAPAPTRRASSSSRLRRATSQTDGPPAPTSGGASSSAAATAMADNKEVEAPSPALQPGALATLGEPVVRPSLSSTALDGEDDGRGHTPLPRASTNTLDPLLR